MGEVTSNTVIAVATVVNVLVTAVYAVFTLLLWRETRAAAQTAAEQIRLTRLEQGLRLRPYVSVTTEIDRESARPSSPSPFTCRFVLANKGPVPAHIRLLTGWLELDGQQQPATESERYGVIFPEAAIGTGWHHTASPTEGDSPAARRSCAPGFESNTRVRATSEQRATRCGSTSPR